MNAAPIAPSRGPNTTDDRFNRAVGFSIALHGLVFLLFAVRAVFYPSEPLQLDNAIQVDIVELPDKQTALHPEIPPPLKPPPVPVSDQPPPPINPAKPGEPTVNLNKTKHTEDAALKRIAALEKLESESDTKPAPDAKQAPPKPTLVKGNIVSQGSDLRGIVRLEHQSYLQSIDRQVKSHWNLPQWLSSANLSAKVRLFIDVHGNVLKKQMTVSSHNQTYDERVLSAIDSAAPLPPPPSDLVNVVSFDGIELEFD